MFLRSLVIQILTVFLVTASSAYADMRIHINGNSSLKHFTVVVIRDAKMVYVASCSRLTIEQVKGATDKKRRNLILSSISPGNYVILYNQDYPDGKVVCGLTESLTMEINNNTQIVYNTKNISIDKLEAILAGDVP